MNKKISQFEAASKFNSEDIIPIIQDNENKIIHGDNLNTSLSETFATNERVDNIESDVTSIDNKVSSNYTDLSTKITEGDQTVTSNVTSTINSYFWYLFQHFTIKVTFVTICNCCFKIFTCIPTTTR